MTRTHGARLGACVLVLWAMSAAGTAGAEPAPETKPLTLEECVSIGVLHNADSLASEYDVKGAEATRSGARGQFGPKLHVDAAVDEWDSPFSLPFGGTVFQVRDQFTWTASVTVSQPLTSLWQIYDQYRVEDFGVDIASVRRRVVRREVAFTVVQAYYGVLETMRLSEVADASVNQLEAQERQAHSLYDNGVIGKNDMLRASVALATARQRSIEVRGQIVISQARLAQAMGVSPDESLHVVAFQGEPPPAEEPDMATAESRALAQRLEVSEVDRRIAQSEARLGAAKSKLAPQVSAVANYTHFHGSAFQQADAEYIGLLGSWDVWDWGTTSSGIGQADAQLQQARIALRKLQDQIRVDARDAFVKAQTAREGLGVARAAVSQAEENYRIVTKKFENSAATSFDVVDAESILTQARAQVETVLYDYLVSRAALERATGDSLAGQ